MSKCLGHHYAIWASDSNFLLALISGTDTLKMYNSCVLVRAMDRHITGNGLSLYKNEGRHGSDRMVVGITTTYAISAYHH